jgi:hypothetical protein
VSQTKDVSRSGRLQLAYPGAMARHHAGRPIQERTNIARKNDDAAGASAEHADGFSRFRQVTQTPVNVVLELRP